MPARQMTDTPLAPELEAIADAAADRLRAEADPHTNNQAELQRQLAEAASAAIGAGAPLGAIADAERVGQARARDELGSDALKRIARASRHRREADGEYEQEILRAGRIGLTHREIAQRRRRRARDRARHPGSHRDRPTPSPVHTGTPVAQRRGGQPHVARQRRTPERLRQRAAGAGTQRPRQRPRQLPLTAAADGCP